MTAKKSEVLRSIKFIVGFSEITKSSDEPKKGAQRHSDCLWNMRIGREYEDKKGTGTADGASPLFESG